jgi:Ankyrin repeats (3 copies)/NACHT domain
MKASDSDDFEIVDSLEVAEDVVADKKPDLAKIKAWLKPSDYVAASSEFNRHLSSQSPGTGEWIRETTQFRQWHSSDNHGSIWIKAVPGAGKSVVAASMVDSLARHESVPVLFFFFRQIIESNRTARSLLRDWLCQLLPSSVIVQALLWELAEENVDLESISAKQLWKYLLAGLRAIERVYCVVDALDEMNIDQDFLSQLNDLGSFRPAHVKVLMTSRPKQYLQRALRDPQVIHVALEEELVKRDVSIFAGQRVALLEQYDVDKDTQEFIKNTVLERSTGLFLYARLMLDQIENSVAQNDNIQLSDIRDMINKLPVGLEDMYNTILSDVSTLSNVAPETQRLILTLVTKSVRPLRLIEIAHALGSKHGDRTGSRSSKDIVRTACGPLLEIMEDEVVQILHHSFTEFLLDTTRNQRTSDTSSVPQFPVLDPVSGHDEIAMACLSYLQLAKFDLRKDRWDTDYSKVYLEHPFFEYSATNWTYHAALCAIEATLLDKLEAFCTIENPRFKEWVRFIDEVVFDGTHYDMSWERPTALHIASCFGLTAWVKILVRKGANVNAMDSTQSTALFWAAHNGFSEIVELLLEAGASPDLDRYDGLKPLHVAAKRNYAMVVKVLVNAGECSSD